MLQVSYQPLWDTLSSRGMIHKDLVRLGLISAAMLKKMEHREPVSLNVLMTVCDHLYLPVESAVKFERVE